MLDGELEGIGRSKSMLAAGAGSRAWILVLVVAALLTGCGKRMGEEEIPAVRTIRIVGSDTMQPLLRHWARAYAEVKPGTVIEPEGGGTGTGIEALIAGETDVCAASRTMRPDEVKRLLDNRSFLGLSVLTGKDALSVYLHPDNPVRNLSLDELKVIFSGEISNWKDVGGLDQDVHVISRQPNSGTYLFFMEHVLFGESYDRSAKFVQNTSAVVREVAANPGGTGYGGMAYGQDVYHCRIEGVEPTKENVRNGTYPLARYLYLYTAGPLEGEIKDFTDWVLSDDGQRVVEAAGYIPLWEVDAESRESVGGP
jgi:phosphate transport system substrate-binding protein